MVDIQIGDYSDIGTNGRQLVSVRMLYDLMDSVDVLANETVQQMLRDTCGIEHVDKFTLREDTREFVLMSCTSMFQRSVLATYLMDTEHIFYMDSYSVDWEILDWICYMQDGVIKFVSYSPHDYKLYMHKPLCIDGKFRTPYDAHRYLEEVSNRKNALTKLTMPEHTRRISSIESDILYPRSAVVHKLSMLTDDYRIEVDIDYNVRMFCDKILTRNALDKWYYFYYSVDKHLQRIVPVKHPTLHELLNDINREIPAMDDIGGILVSQEWRYKSGTFFDNVVYNIRCNGDVFDIYSIKQTIDEVTHWLMDCDWGDIEYM